MKRFLFLIVSTLLINDGFAQQLPLFSQYMFNNYVINPAAAGSKEYIPVTISYRKQWAGFNDAPSTATISGHGSAGERVGLGGLVFSDRTGPISKTGFQLSYSYHLPLTYDDLKLSFGLSGLLYQSMLEQGSLTTDQPGDLAITGATQKAITPDAAFGMYLYNNKYYAGFSAPQLFESKVKYTEDGSGINPLVRHYFLTGGYKIGVNDDIKVEPSLLLKSVGGAPVQLDINAKVFYQEFIWAGASFRAKESVVMMLGLSKNMMAFGYSYDMTLSNIKTYSSGSHEVFLALHLTNTKKKSKVKQPELGPDTTTSPTDEEPQAIPIPSDPE